MKLKYLLLLCLLQSCSLDQYTSPTGERYTGVSIMENTTREVTKAGSYVRVKEGKDQIKGVDSVGSTWLWGLALEGALDLTDSLGSQSLNNAAAVDASSAALEAQKVNADVTKFKIANPVP